MLYINSIICILILIIQFLHHSKDVRNFLNDKKKQETKSVLTICETFGNEKRNQMKYNRCCHVQESNIY